MGRGLAALAFLCLWTVATSARADKLQGTTGVVVQKSHRVTVTLRPGHARWIARRTFMSIRADDNQAVVDIDVPSIESGVGLPMADGIPVALSLPGPAPLQGEVLPAGIARARYRGGGGNDVASALFEAGDHGARLWLTPLRKNQPLTVEYELTLPVKYEGGRYQLEVPPEGDLAPVIVARAEGGTLFVQGAPWPSGEQIRTNRHRPTVLALAPDGATALRGRVGVIPVGDEFIVHVQTDAPPRMSRAPRNAQVVIVLDASRSMSAAASAGAIAAARAYLSHLPDARVELVTFNREASRRYGELVPQKQALADLDDLVLERRNGSDVALALAEARAVLAAAEPDASKRIVVLSDGLLDDSRVDAAIDADLARVHFVKVGVPEEDGVLLLPESMNGVWKNSLGKTGGLSWTSLVSSNRSHAAEMKRAFEQLVRPMSIEDMKATSAAWVGEVPCCLPFSLIEGAGSNDFFRMDKPVPWLKVQGEIWATRLEVTLPVVEDNTASSALALGSRTLSDAEIAEVATRVGAVTAQTSLLAGTASEPPREHVGPASFRVENRVITCRASVTGRHPGNRKRWLEDRLRTLWLDCGGALHRATIKIDTTGPEIVAVTAPKISKGALPKMGRCLREKAWDIELPEMFAGDDPTTYRLKVRPMFY